MSVLAKKYYIYVLIFTLQFFFLPVFFNFNINAKFFLFAFVVSILLLLLDIKSLNLHFPPIVIVALFSLGALSSFGAYHRPSAFIATGIFLLLLVYGLLIFPSIFSRGLDCLFFSLFLVFIQVVSSLGLYQYFSFFFSGKTTVPLIPYLLPPNKTPRVAGIYGQPNLFALLLVVGILVYIFLHLHKDILFKSSNRLIIKARYLPLMTTSLVFFLTGSRAGLIALVLSLMFIVLFFARRNWLSKGSVFRLEIINTFLAIAVAYLMYFLLNKYMAMLPDRGFTDVGMSADARFVFWTASLLIFLNHPWIGVGLDNFKFFLPKYINSAHDFLGFAEYEAMGYTQWSHNELLQLLCEGGTLGLVIVGILLFYFLKFTTLFRKNKNYSLRYFFSYLFLLPFIVQSMFSWPLRHPSLLILFFSFIGSLLTHYPGRSIPVSRWKERLVRSLTICVLLVAMWVGYSGIQMGSFFHNKDYKDNVQSSFIEFEQLEKNPFLQHPLLLETIPTYVRTAYHDKDIVFAKKVLPYCEELVDLHGAHWQWFNLSLLYYVLKQNDDSLSAINQAIKLQPMKQKYWAFQHYLNMLKASEETGRPLEDFLPIPPGGTIEDLKGIFNFDDGIKFNI